jgi:hypothetical protein
VVPTTHCTTTTNIREASQAYSHLPKVSSTSFSARYNYETIQNEPEHFAEHGLVLEHVIADCRLEFAELVRIDQVVELAFLDNDRTLAYPLRERALACDWVRRDDGWIKVPTYVRLYDESSRTRNASNSSIAVWRSTDRQ